ncbi:hypothetical protein SDC9_191857 [bioreactor metagenome]|uniref:Uncharacterized protein n=1 Tax=bioreactor metagenome TaxID=1076179 RepID=A0A645HZ28_9ZZZZ
MSEYQEIDFDVNPLEYGLDPDYTFSNVTLKIVYDSHDVATKQIKVMIYDTNRGWVNLTEDLPPQTSTFETRYYNLTDYIHNAEDLENFDVKIVACAENVQKSVYIDYMGLWIE